MEEVAVEVAMRGCCACTARAGSGCAVEIGAVEEVAVEVAAEVAMRGGCACTARAGSGCANTGVCAITDAGGISVAVDSCSVGDVCGCCCVVLGPAEVPGASGGCCSSTVAVEVISVEFAVEIGAVELAVEVVAVEIGAVEIGAVEVAVGESSRG